MFGGESFGSQAFGSMGEEVTVGVKNPGTSIDDICLTDPPLSGQPIEDVC